MRYSSFLLTLALMKQGQKGSSPEKSSIRHRRRNALNAKTPLQLLERGSEKSPVSWFLPFFGVLIMIEGCYLERDYEVTPPPKTHVARQTESLFVSFRPHHVQLSQPEQRRLDDGIQKALELPSTPLYARLQIPSGTTKEQKNLTQKRLDSLIQILKKRGIPSHRISVFQGSPKETAQKASFSFEYIGVFLDHYRVVPPRCLRFDEQDMNGRVPPEGEQAFGCATEQNFAHMIAEPRDLEKGHSLGSHNPVLTVGSITRLQTDKVKELKIEKLDTSKGS